MPPKTAVGARADSPSGDLATASAASPLDLTAASTLPSQLLIVEVLRRPIESTPYTSAEYRKLLEQHGMVSSMSRPGACLDNAAMESWFRVLKAELGSVFATVNQAHVELFEFIEVFYNRERIHSTLRYATPAQFEQQATKGRFAA